MFGDVVMGVDHEHFENAASPDEEEGTASSADTDLPPRPSRKLCRRLQEGLPKHTGKPFPRIRSRS
jgi:hypothetical protein